MVDEVEWFFEIQEDGVEEGQRMVAISYSKLRNGSFARGNTIGIPESEIESFITALQGYAYTPGLFP